MGLAECTRAGHAQDLRNLRRFLLRSRQAGARQAPARRQPGVRIELNSAAPSSHSRVAEFLSATLQSVQNSLGFPRLMTQQICFGTSPSPGSRYRASITAASLRVKRLAVFDAVEDRGRHLVPHLYTQETRLWQQ